MNTHPFKGGNRRLALLVSLYASLCSVLALQLAVQWSATHAQLRATTSSVEVSLLPGSHGITEKDLRSYQQTRANEDRVRARAKVKATVHGAATRGHQARSR